MSLARSASPRASWAAFLPASARSAASSLLLSIIFSMRALFSLTNSLISSSLNPMFALS